MRSRIRQTALVPVTLLALVTLGLAACGEDEQKPVEYVRAIKSFTVTEVASGQLRKFTGVVRAADSSPLSFQIAGNVQTVAVKLGDKVAKGQVLATLDRKPYQLDVSAAEAELGKARANLAQQKAELDRQRKLFEKGWIAKARLDQVVRGFESGEGDVSLAVAQLDLARRDLGNTVLRAPFDGVVAAREVEPFTEVQAGQRLFEIDARGSFEVTFDVPETTISRLTVGMPVTVRLASSEICPCDARITEIGEVAGSANAFPLKATLTDPPAAIRSGMTAEVTLEIADRAGGGGYLVPLSAIAPGDRPEQGYVFVFDRASSSVRRVAVTGRAAEHDLVAIRGVKPGDIVAIAGVHFLVDGQKVTLMTP